jgi:hypothetical protein
MAHQNNGAFTGEPGAREMIAISVVTIGRLPSHNLEEEIDAIEAGMKAPRTLLLLLLCLLLPPPPPPPPPRTTVPVRLRRSNSNKFVEIHGEVERQKRIWI